MPTLGDRADSSRTIILVCSARDYHAMDWFDEVKRIATGHNLFVATDVAIARNEPDYERRRREVIKLCNIDWLLSKKQSRLADHWRNAVKAISIPLQVFMLRRLARSYEGALFHAHSMYYIVLCWLAQVTFVATPMGSDVLVRPRKSRLYRTLTKWSLKGASVITADSSNMCETIWQLSKRQSVIIQNGIDVRAIREHSAAQRHRSSVTSIRGVYPNYQILRLLETRNTTAPQIELTIVYPFFEKGYLHEVEIRLRPGDRLHGPLSRPALYELLASTLLVVSIPESDSSPRSVYEAIFCGCCVATTYAPWIAALPTCMKSRLTVVDLNRQTWLIDAIEDARQIADTAYKPSIEALSQYDQHESMKRVCRDIYRIDICEPSPTAGEA